MLMRGATMEEKFFAHTYPEPNTGCWLWGGYHNGYGYGRIYSNHKAILAHRFSFEFHKGQLLGDLFVCHTCNNTYCVNPDHLYIGTQKMNMRQAFEQGRCGGNMFPEKPVNQFDLNGKLIATYRSIMEITRLNPFKQPGISNVCNGKKKTAYGYKWAFATLPDATADEMAEDEQFIYDQYSC